MRMLPPEVDQHRITIASFQFSIHNMQHKTTHTNGCIIGKLYVTIFQVKIILALVRLLKIGITQKEVRNA